MFDKEYNDDLQNSNELVKRYENALLLNENSYFDESELEEIVDFYLFNSNFEKALEAANNGLEQYKFSTTFYQKKAEVYIELNDLSAAMENIELAESLSPAESSLMLLKADVYTQQRKFKLAVKIVQELLDNAPKDEKVDLYLELADVYEEWEKYFKVIENLQNCLFLEPNNEEALNRMWFTIELTEHYDQSIAFHSKLVDKDPYSAGAWYNLAHAYNGVNNFDKALESFEFVLAIDEEYTPAYIDAGDLLFKQEKYETAIEYFEQFLDKNGANKEIYYKIAESFQFQGKYAKARGYLKKAINIDPYFAKAFHKLSLNYIESDMPKSAISPIERAVKIEANSYEFLNTLAAAYFLNDKLNEALEVYTKMLTINDLDKRIYLNIISILYEQGRVGDAIDVIDGAIALFEQSGDLMYIKTVFLYEIGKKNEMYDSLLKALEKDVDGHSQLFELLPEMKNDNAVMALIESYL